LDNAQKDFVQNLSDIEANGDGVDFVPEFAF
jgi:hypothetical protein